MLSLRLEESPATVREVGERPAGRVQPVEAAVGAHPQPVLGVDVERVDPVVGEAAGVGGVVGERREGCRLATSRRSEAAVARADPQRVLSLARSAGRGCSVRPASPGGRTRSVARSHMASPPAVAIQRLPVASSSTSHTKLLGQRGRVRRVVLVDLEARSRRSGSARPRWPARCSRGGPGARPGPWTGTGPPRARGGRSGWGGRARPAAGAARDEGATGRARSRVRPRASWASSLHDLQAGVRDRAAGSSANASGRTAGENRNPWYSLHPWRRRNSIWSVLLDAFRHHPQAELAGHGDGGARDGGVFGGVADPAHERLVDLQDVDRELLQVGDRRVAGAEVVDGQAHARGRGWRGAGAGSRDRCAARRAR